MGKQTIGITQQNTRYELKIGRKHRNKQIGIRNQNERGRPKIGSKPKMNE